MAHAPSQVIEDMVRIIAERFVPEKIILLGSQARGDADPASDVDLLVLFKDADNRRARGAELYKALAGVPAAKDVVVSTVHDFERYKNVVNTIYWPAAREGKVVYERSR